MANSNLHGYTYYPILNMNNIIIELLFPIVEEPTSNFIKLSKKINLTLGSTNPVVSDPLLYEEDGYKLLDYTNNSLLVNDRKITEIYDLIPVKILLRKYDEYTILLKDRPYTIDTSAVFDIKVDSMSIINEVKKPNDMLYGSDEYYRVGSYEEISVRSSILLKLGLPMKDVMELPLDYDNYMLGHVEVPSPLYGTPDMLPNTIVYKSLLTTEKKWYPMTFISDLMSININKVKSHIIRKFINDIRREVIEFTDGDYNSVNTITLISNYVNRTWTDELRKKLMIEFPYILNVDDSDIWEHSKFIMLSRLSTDKEEFIVPTDIKYYKDKEYILNTLAEQRYIGD